MAVPDRIPFAAILAGGRATRMGRDKATIRLGGSPIIERVLDRVQDVAETVFVVGGQPYLDHRNVPTISDLYPGANAMGGIATALVHAAKQGGVDSWVLCVPCDAPFLNPRLLLHLFEVRAGHDIVVPKTTKGYEPLCALYSVACLGVFERWIAAGNLRIFDVYPEVRCREEEEDELRRFDPQLLSFINVNSPEDLAVAEQLVSCRDQARSARAPGPDELLHPAGHAKT